MTESRLVAVAIVTVLVALGAANALVYVEARSTHGVPAGDDWKRWRSMSRAERQGFVDQYRVLTRRPDAELTWRRAVEFGRLPAADQDRLLVLGRAAEEILAQEPAATRREYVRASDEARAYLIYHQLRDTDPNRLAALRALWPAP